MTLSPAVAREAIHNRSYDFHGYRREDGLWDIEGRILDTKAYAFENAHRGTVESGEPVHEMEVRLTLNDGFEVIDCEATTLAGPFEICPAITPNFKRLVGLKVGPGWRKAVRNQVGGAEGCTHIVEMIFAMATVAYQTMVPILSREGKLGSGPKAGERKRPPLLDSCHAFASDGEIARQSWPEYYTGDKEPAKKARDL